MTTLDLTGQDFGYNQVRVGDHDFYDARGLTVNVEQGTKLNTGIRVTGSPKGARWLGGQVLGTNPFTNSWVEVKNGNGSGNNGNGAGLMFENASNFTLEGVFIRQSWDGIRPANEVPDWLVKRCWLKDVRDDGIENDHVYNGRVEFCLLEDVHSFYSATPGKGLGENPDDDTSIGSDPRHTVEFVGNLMSLGRHLEDREKRLKYAWAREQGSGQAFKVAGDGDGMKLLLKDNVVMLRVGPNTSGRNLPIPPDGVELLPGSGNNTFIWLGGPDYQGLEMERIHGVLVPKLFKIDPALFTTVTDDPLAWAEARERWIAEVWGAAGPGPDPEPTPDPEPEPEPAPDPRIPELQAILSALRGKAAELTRDLDAALELLEEEN